MINSMLFTMLTSPCILVEYMYIERDFKDESEMDTSDFNLRDAYEFDPEFEMQQSSHQQLTKKIKERELFSFADLLSFLSVLLDPHQSEVPFKIGKYKISILLEDLGDLVGVEFHPVIFNPLYKNLYNSYHVTPTARNMWISSSLEDGDDKFIQEFSEGVLSLAKRIFTCGNHHFGVNFICDVQTQFPALPLGEWNSVVDRFGSELVILFFGPGEHGTVLPAKYSNCASSLVLTYFKIESITGAAEGATDENTDEPNNSSAANDDVIAAAATDECISKCCREWIDDNYSCATYVFDRKYFESRKLAHQYEYLKYILRSCRFVFFDVVVFDEDGDSQSIIEEVF